MVTVVLLRCFVPFIAKIRYKVVTKMDINGVGKTLTKYKVLEAVSKKLHKMLEK